jgi:uncharacterized protein (TIGR02453 family)
MLGAMDAGFRGFGPEVFAWFEGLERDNSRAYFEATRERFERDVRGGLQALLDELSGEFGGEVRVFRQHRDLRFARDKSPYKTRTYGVLHDRPGAGASLYAELSSRGLYAGSGYHQMTREQLERYRAAVSDDASGPRLEQAAAGARAAGLELVGAALRTAPRGYPRGHPRIELLRLRSLIVGRRLAAGDLPRRVALDHVAGTWRAAAPLNAWLDAHVGQAPPE